MELQSIQLCVPWMVSVWLVMAILIAIIGHSLINEWFEDFHPFSEWVEMRRLEVEAEANMAAAEEEERLHRLVGPVQVRYAVAFTRDSISTWSTGEVGEEEEDNFYRSLSTKMGDCEVHLLRWKLQTKIAQIAGTQSFYIKSWHVPGLMNTYTRYRV